MTEAHSNFEALDMTVKKFCPTLVLLFSFNLGVQLHERYRCVERASRDLSSKEIKTTKDRGKHVQHNETRSSSRSPRYNHTSLLSPFFIRNMSQQQRVMDVHTGTWAEKLAHAEAKVKLHVKKHVRQKVFFQRQLDKAQGLSNQLRDELNEAKNKLVAVERGAKKIDRNMEVAQCDMDREHKQLRHSLEQQVVKVATMLANRRELSRDAWDASAIRARAGNQKIARMASGILVRVLIFLFA